MKEFIDNIGKEIRLKGKVWVEQVWNLTANKSIGKIEKDITGEILKSSKETNKECSTRLDEVADLVKRLEDVIIVVKEYEKEATKITCLQRWQSCLKKLKDMKSFFVTSYANCFINLRKVSLFSKKM